MGRAWCARDNDDGGRRLTTAARVRLVAAAAALIVIAADVSPVNAGEGHDGGVHFEPFDDAIVARAADEKKLVLLVVGTTWCHWCHVMDETTWREKSVVSVLAKTAIAVKADADENPDLSRRFEPWGWPAIIVIDERGEVVLAIKGYRNPTDFLALYEPVVDARARGDGARGDGARGDAARGDAEHRATEHHATENQAVGPETTASTPSESETPLSEVRFRLRAALDAFVDVKNGGWGGPKKLPLHAPVLHAFVRAVRHDEPERLAHALDSVEKSRALVDDVWGGVFQYSTHNVWSRAHTEKLALTQAESIKLFVEAARFSGDARHLESARRVHKYLRDFMMDDDGTFFANQDADVGTRGGPSMKGPEFYAKDDAARRAVGVPFVDKRIYAEHNGAIIAALAMLSEMTDDDDALTDALTAYDAVMKTHRRDGLMRHAQDDASPTLVDQVAMIEAALALLARTGTRRFRDDAERLVRATSEHFPQSNGLIANAKPNASSTGFLARPFYPLEENARFGRALVTLSSLEEMSDAPALRTRAETIARALGKPTRIENLGRRVGDALLLVESLIDEPIHIAVVGNDKSAHRSVLRRHVMRANAPLRVVEILAPGVRFPDLGVATVFVCGSTFCSRPLMNTDDVDVAIASTLAPSR